MLAVAGKAPLMALGDLHVLLSCLFARNIIKSLKDSALLALQWSLVGRSSGVGEDNFAQLRWANATLLVRVFCKKTH